MKKENIVHSLLSVIMLSIVTIGALLLVNYNQKNIGLLFVAVGLLHLIILKLFGVSFKSVWPDLVFGLIDNGILVIAAIIGADIAGAFGAIIGGSAANAFTDGLAGIFEGWTAQYLRQQKIEEKRTILRSAVGKMAGCFLGAGVVLIIAWNVLSF